MQEATISHYFVQAAISQARRLGIDCDRLLMRARIPLTLAKGENARIPVQQYAALQRLTMLELDDEMLGYSSRPLKIGSWSAVCHWMIASKNLGQALKRFCLFYSLTEKGLQTKLQLSGRQFVLTFTPWDQEQVVKAYGYEVFMFGLHRLLCWLTKTSIPLEEVHLAYPMAASASEYRAMYPRAQHYFDENACQMIFKRELWELPIKQTNDNLQEFLKRPLLNILINHYDQNSWPELTRSYLYNHLQQIPTFVELAEGLNIHPKKLRRKLEAEGISYANLKAEVRRDAAIRYLCRSDKSIEETSALIGFSETSAFTRAFKQWTGFAPHYYRKLNTI